MDNYNVSVRFTAQEADVLQEFIKDHAKDFVASEGRSFSDMQVICSIESKLTAQITKQKTKAENGSLQTEQENEPDIDAGTADDR